MVTACDGCFIKASIVVIGIVVAQLVTIEVAVCEESSGDVDMFIILW